MERCMPPKADIYPMWAVIIGIAWGYSFLTNSGLKQSHKSISVCFSALGKPKWGAEELVCISWASNEEWALDRLWSMLAQTLVHSSFEEPQIFSYRRRYTFKKAWQKPQTCFCVSVCFYVYMLVHSCLCICMCICVHIFMHVCVYICVCMLVDLCACVLCVCVSSCLCF